MRKGNRIYHLLLATILLLIIQMAGVDVYAQRPVSSAPRDTIVVRQPPKARARRHRDTTAVKQNVVPQAIVDARRKAAAGKKVDSTQVKMISPLTADSIDNRNRENLIKIQSPLVVELPKDSLRKMKANKVWIPNSTKATWLSIIFPGGGQIYNRKFWKLPIIYGGFAGCAYALSWNNKMYKDYSQAYLDIMDDNPNTNSYLDLLPNRSIQSYSTEQLKTVIKNRKDMFRRYRDISIFAFIGVYVISIIDAYVDAELSNFDITPDLSMKVEPTIINDKLRPADRSVGLQCSIRF